MKAKNILATLVLALCLVNCLSGVSDAAALGTAFTYQGQLIDANELAEGLYDFQFKLYDTDPCGTRIGPNVIVDDVDVIEGYFTVELDFGSVFDGNATWLEIGVRLGELEDPNGYTRLEPRQELTATPYALYAKTAGSDNDWLVSGDNMSFIPDGNVGIGTTDPQKNKLYVFRPYGHYGADRATIYGYRGGSSDIANGGTSWQHHGIDTAIKGYSYYGNNYTAGVAGYSWLDYPESAAVIGARYNGYHRGMLAYRDTNSKLWSGYFEGDVYSSGNVGIGTDTPTYRLDVNGVARISNGLNPSDDLVIAADDGAEVAIGTTVNSERKLNVFTDSDAYAVCGENRIATGTRYGVRGVAYGDNSSSSYGVRGSSHSSKGNNYGVYGFANVNTSGSNYGVYGESIFPSDYLNYGVYGTASNSGAGIAYAGHFDGDVRMVGNVSIGDVVTSPDAKLGILTDSSIYGLFVTNNKIDSGESRYSIFGITTGDNAEDSIGVYGSSQSTNGRNIGVKGVATFASTGDNIGVYGYALNTDSGDAYAGYFKGNVYVESNCSALSFTDRTPYPSDLATAYEAVMSMERLPDGQYQYDNKEHQLDHSMLSAFVRSDDGNRDLSATVSCLNEVVKDLVKKQRELETANENLKNRLAAFESMLNKPTQ